MIKIELSDTELRVIVTALAVYSCHLQLEGPESYPNCNDDDLDWVRLLIKRLGK